MVSPSLILKALRAFGLRRIGQYVLYQFALRMGYYQWRSPNFVQVSDRTASDFNFTPVAQFPSRDELLETLGEQGLAQLTHDADEIVAGQARLFGALPVSINFASQETYSHWTLYERQSGKMPERDGEHSDIKFIWELSRFGWAFTLGRAYYILGDERYADSFWEYAEAFLDTNPPYRGPNWISAQEAALRLMAFVYALQAFTGSPHSTSHRKERLSRAVGEHAARIPATLLYARAQNNNHLLTEAAGLYTAGVALAEHPSAQRWRSLGWSWFNRGLLSQIYEDGTYMQHSVNYHRLMLQVAIWFRWLTLEREISFPSAVQERLAAATRWLLALLDIPSGRVPNLGPNDGAYIFPLTVNPFHDFRPVSQAASIAFLKMRPLAKGSWDEMALWMGLNPSNLEPQDIVGSQAKIRKSYPILTNATSDSWGILRVGQFNDRPGHADQLHLDLWWRGLNIAQDAGTFLYNEKPPWDNALAGTDVHNTVMVSDRDQMTRVGRFLYLDWVNAQIVSRAPSSDGVLHELIASHAGYRNQGLIHQRSVKSSTGDTWIVEDLLLPARQSRIAWRKSNKITLHWLTQDWEWEMIDVEDKRGYQFRFLIPDYWVRLEISFNGDDRLTQEPRIQVVRGGDVIFGPGKALPTWGWFSPTYGVKNPALSIRATISGRLPLSFTSVWSIIPRIG